MTPDNISFLRQMLPNSLPFPYFVDRESPWILAQKMGEAARVGDLKRTSFARFLERPMVKPVVAASGGLLKREDVRAVAYAHTAANDPKLSSTATVGVLAAFDATWHDFLLTFDAWVPTDNWTDPQTSRNGGNLVIQLGFPSDHSALMGKYLENGTRKMFEFYRHPIARSGRPTLAWARVDIEGREALIEEVQTDWLRFARKRADEIEQRQPRSRHARAMRNYETDLRKRYDKMWPKAMLLATLGLLRDVIGVDVVYMHQPEAGVLWKRIEGCAPPRSLYSQLPHHFGFEPTNERPCFLDKFGKRRLARLRRQGIPIFWRYAFDA